MNCIDMLVEKLQKDIKETVGEHSQDIEELQKSAGKNGDLTLMINSFDEKIKAIESDQKTVLMKVKESERKSEETDTKMEQFEKVVSDHTRKIATFERNQKHTSENCDRLTKQLQNLEMFVRKIAEQKSNNAIGSGNNSRGVS